MDTLIQRLVLAALMVIAFLFFQIRPSHGENSGVITDQLTLGFSAKFLNDVSRADAQVALELWIKEMSKGIRFKTLPKPVIYDTVQEMKNAVRNKEVDFIALNTLDYLNIRDTAPLEPVFVGDKGKELGGDQLVIVARHDQGISNVSQLKGKKLIMHAGVLLDSAHLWLRSVLAKTNLPEKESFFGSIQEMSKVTQSLLPVFFKQADAAVLTRNSFETMAELNPQIGKDMTVLLSSEKLLHGLFCFRKDLNADIKAMVLNNALNLKDTQAGRQVFMLFQIKTITPFKPTHLTTTLSLINDQNRLTGRVSNKKN